MPRNDDGFARAAAGYCPTSPNQGGTCMQLQNLNDVFVEQLADLYSAEQQLVTALPKVAEAASEPELEEAITEHLEETRGHVKRLEKVFEELSITPPGETCKAMQGLI